MALKSSDLKPYQQQHYRSAIDQAIKGLNEDQVSEFVNERNIFDRTGQYSGTAGKAVKAALDKLPQNNEELNKFIIENTKDFGILTPKEFGERISALQDLPTKNTGVNLEGFKNFIEGQINKEIYRVNEEGKNKNDPVYSVLGSIDIPSLSDQLAKSIFASPSGDISQVISDPRIAGALADVYKRAKDEYNLSVTPQVTGISAENINKINETQQALKDYQAKYEAEIATQNFINSLPAELARNREQFIGQQQQQASQEFTQNVAPDIAQILNARGILNSGDLPSELARGAASTFNPVQQAAMDLQAQDDQFFQNAGYQNALRREIEAGHQVSNQLGVNRQTSLVNQQMNFERTQAGLRRQFEENQFVRANERAYIQEQQRLQNQQNAQRTQRQNDLVYGIAGNVANIAGSYAGDKLSGVTTGGSTTTSRK